MRVRATKTDYRFDRVSPTKCRVTFVPTGSVIHSTKAMTNTDAQIQRDYDMVERNNNSLSFWYLNDCGGWKR